MAVTQGTFQGNLTNIELKFSGNGNAYTRGRLAISKGPDEESMWFDFVAFGDLAQNIDETFKTAGGGKSLRAVVTGKVEINTYESGTDQKGQPIKRQSTQIVAEDVGVSLKYAQVGSINRGYQQGSDQGNQGMEQVDQPVARPMSQVDSGDAPF
jgi:single-stranded DNA-binding protein|tara:strand:+ start:2096 stop:2557 length:462 start_codon:yes stop_codon:yes gene_type:complete